jgi:hypothetical protein
VERSKQKVFESFIFTEKTHTINAPVNSFCKLRAGLASPFLVMSTTSGLENKIGALGSSAFRHFLNKSCRFIWNGYNLDGFRIKYGMTPHRITVWTYLLRGKHGLHRRSGDG